MTAAGEAGDGRDPAAEYHEALAGSAGEAVAADSHALLEAQQQDRGITFGDRLLCTVLRPRLLRRAEYEFLQRTGAHILRAFEAVGRRALDDDALRAQFGLTGWEEELVRDDPGFPATSPVARLDSFFTKREATRPEGTRARPDDPALTGLYFTEYNAESPAGAAYNDVLTEVFYSLPAVRLFQRSWELRPLPARHHTLHALLDAWHAWSGGRRRPRICILDWAEVPTYSEFVLFRDYFVRQGLDCAIADPRHTEYRDGKLWAEGAPVDLIYKRVLISELVERGGMDQPVVRAVRDRAVCLVNPFRCKILHKKASLAVLSDERNHHLLDAEARAAVLAHVPWTRVVEERTTVHGARTVDLLESVAKDKNRFVLKPNDEYGGKGIVLGWEVDQAAWEAALRTALAEPYIVQERVALPSEPYPHWSDGTVQVMSRMLDTAPYAANGAYVDGCLTRLSTAALLNVTAGGGSTVPTFVTEPR